MKKILLMIVGVVVAAPCIYVAFVIVRAPRYAPVVPAGELSLEKAAQKGLHLETMSVEKGLTGWYERGDYIVYFGSKRGGINPWIERILFEAPKFSVSTVWRDNVGYEFMVVGDLYGGFMELPSNKKNSRIDQTDNALNFILASEAIAILKKTKINPALDYEYDSLVSSEVPEEDYHYREEE